MHSTTETTYALMPAIEVSGLTRAQSFRLRCSLQDRSIISTVDGGNVYALVPHFGAAQLRLLIERFIRQQSEGFGI